MARELPRRYFVFCFVFVSPPLHDDFLVGAGWMCPSVQGNGVMHAHTPFSLSTSIPLYSIQSKDTFRISEHHVQASQQPTGHCSRPALFLSSATCVHVCGCVDVQGKGIMHAEMPIGKERGHGLQLWVNLKSKDKMVDPAYQVCVWQASQVGVLIIGHKSLS